MGSAFAHEIRSPERALAARRRGSSFVGEAVVRIAAIVGARAEAIAEPAQRQTRGLRYTHHVPAAGDRVTEGVQTALGIERRPIGCRKNDAGSSNCCGYESRARGAHT